MKSVSAGLSLIFNLYSMVQAICTGGQKLYSIFSALDNNQQRFIGKLFFCEVKQRVGCEGGVLGYELQENCKLRMLTDRFAASSLHAPFSTCPFLLVSANRCFTFM